MPELPEVETVKRGLEPVLAHVHIIKVEQNRPDLRFPFPKDFVKRLEGQKVGTLSRRAKYLLIPLESRETLVMHLGMSGRVTIQKAGEQNLADLPNPVHDHVLLTLENGAIIRYNDPRRFGFMTLIKDEQMESHKLFADLGPEPLGNHFHARHLAQVAQNRKAPLKNFLLNQKTVAGLGNIYVCEALYRAGLSPQKQAHLLTRKNGSPTKAAEHLVAMIKQVLREAVEQGGSTLRDHRLTDGTLGYFQHSFAVYGRENTPCRTQKCDGTIKRITQAGRSTFYCPNCQK